MDHDLGAEGPAFRLRPVALGDAEFILGLRLDPQLSRYLHPVPPEVEAQRRWISEYLRLPGDYYWLVTRHDDAPEGTIGLYDFDSRAGTAEWGRWVLRPGSVAAAESALLLYDLAFGSLGLKEVRCRTVAANERVIHFHTACGLRSSDRTGTVNLDGVDYPLVEQRLSNEEWRSVRPALLRRAEAAASLLNR